MSTYHTSRILTASSDYICGNLVPGRGCGRTIERGVKYLSFAPGQRGRIPICLTKGDGRLGCAYAETTFGLKYNCAAMVAEVARDDDQRTE